MDGEVGKKAVKDLKDLLGPRLRSCWDLELPFPSKDGMHLGLPYHHNIGSHEF